MNRLALLINFICMLILVVCATPQLTERNAVAQQVSRIQKGMTGEEVVLRWGNPDRVVERSGIGPYWDWYYGDRFLLQFSRPDGVYIGDKRILQRIGILGGSIPSVREWVESASKQAPAWNAEHNKRKPKLRETHGTAPQQAMP